MNILDKDTKEYIEAEVKKIAKNHFNIVSIKNLNKYSGFLTKERLKEINLFRKNKLINRHIYNLTYLYLINEEKLHKELIIEKLKNEVEFNNSEIELINANKIKYEKLTKLEELDNLKEVKEKSYGIKTETIPNDVIPYSNYIFCTNCGKPIYGGVREFLAYSACACNQINKENDLRTKNYCGNCGNKLHSQYCGYCGSKTY